MTAEESVREDIRGRLHEAIKDLRQQLVRVEIWAEALDGFSKSVPDYQPNKQFSLPRRPRKDR